MKRNGWKSVVCRSLFGGILAVGGGGTGWAAQTPQLTAEYQNIWSVDVPGGVYSNYYDQGVGAPFFGGSSATNLWMDENGNTSTVVQTSSSGLRLEAVSFGQPVEAQVAQYALGDVIVPPVGARTDIPPVGFVPQRAGNQEAAYYESTQPQGGAFWIPST
ncbi:MAG: hypothetical protein LBN38_07330, partial [Verrucomicrobiota bacterium]|nr:hypothetical protein [Verrucomicrobiota bacterium]